MWSPLPAPKIFQPYCSLLHWDFDGSSLPTRPPIASPPRKPCRSARRPGGTLPPLPPAHGDLHLKAVERRDDEDERTNEEQRAGIKEDLPFNEFPSASTKNDEHRKACLYVRMSWCDAEVLDLSRDLFRVGSDISGCDKCHSCIFLTEASTCRC